MSLGDCFACDFLVHLCGQFGTHLVTLWSFFMVVASDDSGSNKAVHWSINMHSGWYTYDIEMRMNADSQTAVCLPFFFLELARRNSIWPLSAFLYMFTFTYIHCLSHMDRRKGNRQITFKTQFISHASCASEALLILVLLANITRTRNQKICLCWQTWPCQGFS